MPAVCLSASGLPTEVPPNFMTSVVISAPPIAFHFPSEQQKERVACGSTLPWILENPLRLLRVGYLRPRPRRAPGTCQRIVVVVLVVAVVMAVKGSKPLLPQ
jgi:hypothetical protein